MSFEVRVAGEHPRGMRLVNVVRVPGLDDYCSVAYADRRDRGFRIVERLSTDGSVDQELEITQDDHEFVEGEVRRYLMYGGTYLTEPIDGRYWAPSRRRLVWYEDDVRLEVEGVLDGFTTVVQLLRIADRSRRLTDLDLVPKRCMW
ncbi:MAG: hypothetical protein QM714_10685 [Nocardioides sp.]|uniref:hypothetical protein n=1 Tax=Nocardioides sp. TaxID=35761 RepID=UPI0039E2505D